LYPADIEFANHRGSRYWATYEGEDIPQSVDDYYRAIDDVIKSYYQGAVDFRLGGELKFSPIAIRLGGAYYSSPYADNSLKASRAMIGGGLGYRDRGIFVDLTFVETFNTDVSFPYRLADKANTFAELKNQRANVLLTVWNKILNHQKYDLMFGQTFNKDFSFPYRLYDKANTFAELKNQRANVLLTVGIKL
jgi:hypothetical protein